MQQLFNKTIDDPVDHVLKYTLSYLSLKKIPDEKWEKVRSDDNIDAINRFLDSGGMCMYLFALNHAGMPVYMTDPPPPEKIKQKMVLAIRTRPPKASSKDEPIIIDMTNIDQEVLFMEINK
jgi:hypothetical protein